METAVEVSVEPDPLSNLICWCFRNNLISKQEKEVSSEAGFASEVSEDYNSLVDNHGELKGSILKRTRSLKVKGSGGFRVQRQISDIDGGDDEWNEKSNDSGFNSEHNSSFIGSEHPSGGGSDCIPSAIFNGELHSSYLQHYGLDGPIPEPVQVPCQFLLPPEVAYHSWILNNEVAKLDALLSNFEFNLFRESLPRYPKISLTTLCWQEGHINTFMNPEF